MNASRQQCLYLLWVRPLTALTALALFGIFEAFADGPGADFLLVLALAAAAGGIYAAAAAWRYSGDLILFVSLVVDTVLITALTLLVDRPEISAIGFVWPLAISAFLLTPRATLLVTGLAATGAALAAGLGPDPQRLTVLGDALALLLIGTVLALLSRTVRSAELELARTRDLDQSALRISERVRSTLELHDVLSQAADELQQITGVARALVRLPGADAVGFQSMRDGFEPIDLQSVPDRFRVSRLNEPTEMTLERAEGDFRGFLERYGIQSLIAFPVKWRGENVAVFGLHDDRLRDWEAEGTRALMERVMPQIGAAVAQALAFEQQRRSVAQLQEIARLRQELVANVSHELRTPLAATIGFLQTLERTDVEFDETDRRRFLATARSEAERLARLVEDLLELARAGRGQIEIAPSPLSLSEALERAVDAVRAPAERPIGLRIPRDLFVRADSDRIHQVFLNLLANAIQHGSGDITVVGERRDGEVTLRVCDDGLSIPADQVEQLFVPFARLGKQGGGTGLGLAIAHDIVAAHGGTLDYRAGVDGEPHAFVVTLPAAEAEAAA